MTGDQRAERDRLILGGMRLAGRIAINHVRRSASRECMAEDIRSAAMEGLVRAAHAYDPSHGSFSNFAFHRITGAVLDYLRMEDHLKREYRAAAKAGEVEEPPDPVSLDEILEAAGDRFADPNAVDPHAAAERNEAHRLFMARVARMPRQFRTVLARRYGRKEETFVRIGAALGVTESRACQLLRQAQREFLGEPLKTADDDADGD